MCNIITYQILKLKIRFKQIDDQAKHPPTFSLLFSHTELLVGKQGAKLSEAALTVGPQALSPNELDSAVPNDWEEPTSHSPVPH